MGNFGCGDGGWTLAMKIDGTKVQIPLMINLNHCNTVSESIELRFLIFNFRKRLITILISGMTRISTTVLEARLGLTHKRPSYQPTGTHLSPRSALEWRSATRPSTQSSTRTPTLCTHWSLTGITVLPHCAVTCGRRWLAHTLPCSTTVTRKVLMLWLLPVSIRKQESVSLVTTTAPLVTPESGLVQEDILMTPTRVETRHNTHQIMETNIWKPWVTFWCSDK